MLALTTPVSSTTTRGELVPITPMSMADRSPCSAPPMVAVMPLAVPAMAVAVAERMRTPSSR
ncbi:hypothetical protein [Mesobacterium pallidum]|uniref:hypothetical protein n=1 Tax=Mesobacterium pallidum TaxID=2872037 RepID=UPI001EE2D10C|nr:hypothetical protein [Mesobacterium pallidum]